MDAILQSLIAYWGQTNGQQTLADIEYDVVATADQLTYQFYAQPRKAFTVEWGDGTTGTVPTGASTQSHTYAAAGTYTIKVQDTTDLFDGSYYMKPGAGSSSTDATVVACAAMVAEVRSWNTRASTVWAYCFDRCVNMTGMEIPVGTTLINNYAFRGCTNLAISSLPDALASIGSYAFYQCANITLTSLPSSLTSVGQSAFEGCSKLALTSFPTDIASIGTSAFRQCPLITATALPPNVTKILSATFYGCTNLALTSLPANLTEIETNAFRECTHLAFTTLPSSVTAVGTSAFYLAKNNALATIDGTSASINGTAFAACWRPSSNTGYDGQPHTLTFTGTPTSIASTAFTNNEMLTLVVPWALNAVADEPWGLNAAQVVHPSPSITTIVVTGDSQSANGTYTEFDSTDSLWSQLQSFGVSPDKAYKQASSGMLGQPVIYRDTSGICNAVAVGMMGVITLLNFGKATLSDTQATYASISALVTAYASGGQAYYPDMGSTMNVTLSGS